MGTFELPTPCSQIVSEPAQDCSELPVAAGEVLRSAQDCSVMLGLVATNRATRMACLPSGVEIEVDLHELDGAVTGNLTYY